MADVLHKAQGTLRSCSRQYHDKACTMVQMKIATERAKLVRGITATFKKLSKSSEVRCSIFNTTSHMLSQYTDGVTQP